MNKQLPKTGLNLKFLLFLICCLMSFSVRSQVIINLQGPEYAAVCDTLDYEIIIDYSGDGTMSLSTIHLNTDEEIEFAGVVTSPYVRNVRQEGSEIQLDIDGILSCSKGVIIIRYTVPCYLSYKSIEAALSYKINQQTIYPEKAITRVDIPQVFIRTEKWYPSPNSTSTLQIRITNTGHVRIGDFYLEFASFSNQGLFQSGSIGSKFGVRTLKILKSNWGLAGGTEQGLDPGQTATITLVFRWLGCFPNQMQILPYFMCKGVRCEDLSPAVVPPYQGSFAGRMNKLTPLKLGVCKSEDTFYTLKNLSNDTSAFNGMMDIAIWITPNDSIIKVFEKCIESIKVSIDGKEFPLIYNSRRQGYQVDLRTLRQSQTTLTDLNFNNKWNDLSPGDSIIIKIGIQTKGICFDCESDVVERNSGYSIWASYKDHCKLSHHTEVEESFNFPGNTGILIPHIKREGDVTFIEEGVKWVSQHHVRGLEGFRNGCSSGKISLSLNYPRNIRPVMNELKYVGQGGDTILVNGNNFNNQLKITIPHELNPKAILITWVALCYDGDYTIGNKDKEACEQCMSFNTKRIRGELVFECNLPCKFESKLACYGSVGFITDCKLDNRVLSLEFLQAQLQRISTGFTDASLTTKADPVPPGMVDDMGIPGDTVLFSSQFDFDCLEPLQSVNFYLDLFQSFNNSNFRIISSKIKGYNTQAGTSTGVCNANIISFVSLKGDNFLRNIKSEFLKENLSTCLSAETDSVVHELEFSFHLQKWDLNSYRFLLEEQLDGCNRFFEVELPQKFRFHSGLSNSNGAFPTFHSDFKKPDNLSIDSRDSCFITPCKTIFSGILLRPGSTTSGNVEFRPLTGLPQFSITFPSSWEVNTSEAGIYTPVINGSSQFSEFDLFQAAKFLNVTEFNGFKTYKFEGTPPGQDLYVPYDETFYFLVPFNASCLNDNNQGIVRIFYTSDPSKFGLPETLRQTAYRTIPIQPRLRATKNAQALISDYVSWSNNLYYGVGNYRSSIHGVHSRGKIIIRSSKTDLEITDFKFAGTNNNSPIALTRVGDTWQTEIPATLSPNIHIWNYKTTGHSCGIDTIFVEWQPSCLDSDPACLAIIQRDTMVVYSYNPIPDLELEEKSPVWTPCTDNEVTIAVNNLGSGELKEPEIYLNLPVGLSIESVEIVEHPHSAPEIIPPGPGESQWLLRFQSTEINPIPPFQDTVQSEFNLKLSFSVACDIALPFKWEAFMSGIRPCRDSIRSRISVSPYLYFQDLSLSDPVEWNFRMQAGPDCSSGTEMIIDISKINQNWQPNLRDSILLILEGNLIYIPGTAVTSGGQSIPDPRIRYEEGKLRLTWGNLPELLAQAITTLSFRIGHECSETCELIVVSLGLLGYQNLQCTQSPVNCETQFLQSFKTWEDIRLRGKFLQKVEDIDIRAIGNQQYTMRARIGIRSENYTSYIGPVVIRLFQDINLNGWVDPGELLYTILDVNPLSLTDLSWNWFDFSGDFPVDALCNLRISIDLPEKCQCEPSVLSIDPQVWLESLTTDRHCAGTSMRINTDVIPFCSIIFDNNIHLKKEGNEYIFTKDLEEWQSSEFEMLIYQVNCGVCNFKDTLYIETYQILGNFRELNPLRCHGDQDGSLLFIAHDHNIHLNYEWNVNGQNTAQIDNLSAGTYQVRISDTNQCSFIHTYHLMEPEILNSDYSLSSSLCDNHIPTNIILSPNGGYPTYTYQWKTGETTGVLSNINFGHYYYTVTDFNGCTFGDTIQLDEPIWFDFEWETINATCAELADGEILLDLPQGPKYSISLDQNDLGNQAQISGLGANEYELIVKDQTGCAIKLMINIQNKPSFSVSLPSDTTMYLGDTLHLRPTIDWPGSYSFEWAPTEWTDCPNCESVKIFILQPLEMRVVATNHIGCKDSASIKIKLDERIRIFVPNAFSPNKDGINDLFRAYSGPEIEEILSFNIHDRWGSRIFEQSNISPGAKDWGWDGQTRNMEMQPGVFVYHIKVKLINGKEVTLAGDFLLVR